MIYVGIAVLVVGIALYFMVASDGKKIGVKKVDIEKIAKVKDAWVNVEQVAATAKPSAYRAAIVEADKLLVSALKAKGFTGDFVSTMKQAKNNFTNYQSVWDAHKFRNRIVHEIEHEVYAVEAKRILASYKQALKDLGVL